MARSADELDPSPFDMLERLYGDADAQARRLAAVHAGRIHCRPGCSACCVDGITVFAVEAERIRRRRDGLLSGGEAHPPGACAFLDEAGACRIYDDRPYVCRTQGLPLRWIEEREGAAVEFRDICPLNDDGTPLEEIPSGECLTIGPFEERLALAEIAFGGGDRVPLRALFETARSGEE